MALNLAVKQGQSVYVDDKKLTVTEVVPAEEASGVGWTVTVMLEDGTEYELYEDRRIEVFPGVFMQLGLKQQYGKASLVFEAPRSVTILTEKNYALQNQSAG